MSEGIIAALITGACAVVAEVILSAKNTRELFAKLDKQSELADERMRGELAVIKTELTDLRKTVDKHNGVIERTYHLEERVAVQEEKLKVANNRIGDLERTAQGGK